jgi:hypothetical protein
MSVVQVASITGVSASTRRARLKRIFIPAIAVLVAVGAFLYWGPIGLGNGPLGVPSMDGRIGLSTSQPTAFVATLVNTGGSGAVIDGVAVTSAAGYSRARVLTVRVARNSSYGCVYTRLSDVTGCARPPLVTAAGFAVPPGVNTAPGRRGGPALVIEIAGPPPNGCVALTAIVVRYHVGIRHYTATAPQGFVWACGTHARQPSSAG